MTTQPAIAEVAPPSENPDPAMLALLRDFRAEIQDLRMVLDSVCKGETTIQANAKYIAKTMGDLSALMDKIAGDDNVSHLRNIFEQMGSNPLLVNPGRKASAETQLHYMNLLQIQFRKIEFYIGWLTIPDRVNHWLDQARPGYYIPFHIVFENEVSEPEDRAKILSLLAWSPKTIRGGIVDAAKGLIYKYSEKMSDRILSLVYILLAILAATGMVWGASQLDFSGLHFQTVDKSLFLEIWLALLIGVIVHVGIGNLKQSQSARAMPPESAISDIPLLLNTQVGAILRKLFFALLAFFILTISTNVTNSLNPFLVGYSLDSVIEIFATGVEKQAGVQVEEMKKQLGIV